MRSRSAIGVIAATVITFLVGACGSSPPPSATSAADSPTTVVVTPPTSVEGASVEIDTPACALFTVDEVAAVIGSSVSEVPIDAPEGCQWLGDTTVNLLRFPPGEATDSMEDFEKLWKGYKASVTAVPGLGDQAIAVERASLPTRYLAFRTGEDGLQLQSNASPAQLVALGELVLPRL